MWHICFFFRYGYKYDLISGMWKWSVAGMCSAFDDENLINFRLHHLNTDQTIVLHQMKV